MRSYEGKIVNANGKDWLILRQPQQQAANYHYEVYEWVLPQALYVGQGNNLNALRTIAGGLNIQYPANSTTDQLGLII